jgi:hypothetical protein
VDAGVAPRAGVEIDRVDLLPFDLERAQPPGNRRDPARPDRIAPLCRQLRRTLICVIGCAACAISQEYRYRAFCRELLRPRQRACGRADDQKLARRAVRDQRHGLRLGQIGEREERRDLGRRAPGLGRPPAGLADVDELQASTAFQLAVQLAEERRLLRAGDHEVVAFLHRSLERGNVPAAQLAVHVQGTAFLERARDRPPSSGMVRLQLQMSLCLAICANDVTRDRCLGTL